MVVRGAPLIGATARLWPRARADEDAADDAALERAYGALAGEPPDGGQSALRARRRSRASSRRCRRERAPPRLGRAPPRFATRTSRSIGASARPDLPLIEAAHRAHGRAGQCLTHCNAGWLATVDWGTATAPIYLAHDRGVPVHVFVDETRPRNQGASLTAFELGQHGVPHTLIADNAGGHLMQHGQVDLCIVGADRVTARGDAANKIGTYLKALAARANRRAVLRRRARTPRSTGRSRTASRSRSRSASADEVTHITGRLDDGGIARVALAPPGTRAANPAFDVTPAELIDGVHHRPRPLPRH